MKTFKINDKLTIFCEWQKTRNGFKHVAKLKGPHFNTISETKVCYLNRTWESFEFEIVIEKLLSFNTDIIPKQTITKFLKRQKGEYKKQAKKEFSFIAGIAKMGELMTENKTESNDWKKRMLLAGLPGLDIPEDWNTLTESEKELRLNNVINELSK